MDSPAQFNRNEQTMPSESQLKKEQLKIFMLKYNHLDLKRLPINTYQQAQQKKIFMPHRAFVVSNISKLEFYLRRSYKTLAIILSALMNTNYVDCSTKIRNKQQSFKNINIFNKKIVNYIRTNQELLKQLRNQENKTLSNDSSDQQQISDNQKRKNKQKYVDKDDNEDEPCAKYRSKKKTKQSEKSKRKKMKQTAKQKKLKGLQLNYDERKFKQIKYPPKIEQLISQFKAAYYGCVKESNIDKINFVFKPDPQYINGFKNHAKSLAKQMKMIVSLPSVLKITINQINKLNRINNLANISVRIQLKVSIPGFKKNQLMFIKMMEKLSIFLKISPSSPHNTTIYFTKYRSSFQMKHRINRKMYTDVDQYFKQIYKLPYFYSNQFQDGRQFQGVIFVAQIHELTSEIKGNNLCSPFDLFDLTGFVQISQIQTKMQDWQDCIFIQDQDLRQFFIQASPQVTLTCNLISLYKNIDNSPANHMIRQNHIDVLPGIAIGDFRIAGKLMNLQISNSQQSQLLLSRMNSIIYKSWIKRDNRKSHCSCKDRRFSCFFKCFCLSKKIGDLQMGSQFQEQNHKLNEEQKQKFRLVRYYIIDRKLQREIKEKNKQLFQLAFRKRLLLQDFNYMQFQQKQLSKQNKKEDISLIQHNRIIQEIVQIEKNYQYSKLIQRIYKQTQVQQLKLLLELQQKDQVKYFGANRDQIDKLERLESNVINFAKEKFSVNPARQYVTVKSIDLLHKLYNQNLKKQSYFQISKHIISRELHDKSNQIENFYPNTKVNLNQMNNSSLNNQNSEQQIQKLEYFKNIFNFELSEIKKMKKDIAKLRQQIKQNLNYKPKQKQKDQHQGQAIQLQESERSFYSQNDYDDVKYSSKPVSNRDGTKNISSFTQTNIKGNLNFSNEYFKNEPTYFQMKIFNNRAFYHFPIYRNPGRTIFIIYFLLLIQILSTLLMFMIGNTGSSFTIIFSLVGALANLLSVFSYLSRQVSSKNLSCLQLTALLSLLNPPLCMAYFLSYNNLKLVPTQVIIPSISPQIQKNLRNATQNITKLAQLISSNASSNIGQPKFITQPVQQIRYYQSAYFWVFVAISLMNFILPVSVYIMHKFVEIRQYNLNFYPLNVKIKHVWMPGCHQHPVMFVKQKQQRQITNNIRSSKYQIQNDFQTIQCQVLSKSLKYLIKLIYQNAKIFQQVIQGNKDKSKLQFDQETIKFYKNLYRQLRLQVNLKIHYLDMIFKSQPKETAQHYGYQQRRGYQKQYKFNDQSQPLLGGFR